MDDLEHLRSWFTEVRPALNQLADQLQDWLRRCARESGVKEYNVSGRAKQPHSFLRKHIKKQYADPMREMADKVGVRIDVLYLDDLDRVCDRVRAEDEAFQVIKEDVKQPAPNVLDYIGVHFDVVPRDLPQDMDSGMATCEVQVRTMAQATWAMANHDLLYKLGVAVPDRVHRQVSRLMALLEVFDEEVRRARDSVVGHPDYPLAQVIEALEEALLRVSAQETDTELTQLTVEALFADRNREEIREAATRIRDWAENNSSRLAELYEHYRDDDRNPLLFQPEAILVFWELDDGDRYRLKTAWDRHLPHEYLQSLASIWGQPF